MTELAADGMTKISAGHASPTAGAACFFPIGGRSPASELSAGVTIGACRHVRRYDAADGAGRLPL